MSAKKASVLRPNRDVGWHGDEPVEGDRGRYAVMAPCWADTHRAGAPMPSSAGRGHREIGGFCEVCGAVWPCAAARRAGSVDERAPYGVPLSSMIGGAGGCVGGRRRSRLPAVGQSVWGQVARPVALGYVRLTPGSAAVSVVAGMAGLDVFAASRGWRLGEVFVDDDPGRPLLAWAGLTATACGPERVAAVVVPDVPGLRPEALVLERLRVRCAREVGVPLLLAAVEPDQAGRRSPSIRRRVVSASASGGVGVGR